ncbi:MAG: PEP-CTERM sorting domain-containing protein [Coraliomargarita sp. TMED73]|nr:MAG: PEP-CTERM sorting domain-containing protein [Coraliomargarita sp. TMED73]|tara:strand:- start:2038 stop:3141 length:1104 start_codon:yes stop_codon:yes gene_type:complete
MNRQLHRLITGITIVFGIFVINSHLQAQNTFRGWNGSVSDDWADANNWDGGIVPSGGSDTAAVRRGTPDVTNRTVLYNGSSASLHRVFVGEQNSGHLTVQSGATLNTGGDIRMSNTGTLVNNGTINATGGLQAAGTSSVSIRNGGILNGNLKADNTSKVTIDGTLNGNFNIGSSTAEQRIGATGTVNGDVVVSNNDVLTIAGAVSGGLFNVNGTGRVVIESTADIRSEGEDSWLYNTADITWNVGADGSVGTLRTNRGESTTGAFDGEWRYTGSAIMTVVLDDYDTTNGLTISLGLLSGIQNEATFSNNVKFLLNGQDVSSDFTYLNGIFTGNVVPEPGTYALLAGCLGLVAALTRRARRRSSAQPR